MAARGNRALLLMDLGVPRNIEPTARELYNVYLYNLENLTDIVEQNRGAREGEVPRAQAIVEEHVGKFLSWQASVELVSLVQALRARMREERAAFLRERVASTHAITPAEIERTELWMDDLLERLLIEPAEKLRSEKELRRKIQNVEALRDLFLDRREKP
jgi:glutamyl-tRNA reductase